MKLLNDRANCPSCNFNNCKQLLKLNWDNKILFSFFEYRNYPKNYIKEAAYVLMECDRCGLIYQRYSPNDKLSNEIYNNWIVKRRTANIKDYSFNPFSVQNTIRNISEIHQLINFSLKKPSQLKVLDFGMGWGGWCKAAQLMGLEAYGTEINKKQIEYFKTQGLKVIDWKEIPDYNFDIININQVLEHVPNPSLIISHVKKGLTFDGIIKIGVPDAQNIKSNLKKDFQSQWFYAKGESYSLNPVEPLQHLNAFNYKALKYIMSQHGFQHLEQPVGNYYNDSINTLSLKNILYSIARRLIPTRYRTELVFKYSL